MVKYIEFAKLEAVNDDFVRFVGMSFCYENQLVFRKKYVNVGKEHVGSVFKLVYHYTRSDGPMIDSMKVVHCIPVHKAVKELRLDEYVDYCAIKKNNSD